jgi:hypothetical protein
MGPMGPRPNPMAIASLVLGILSIPSCCCAFAGTPMSIAAVVLGIVAMQKIKAQPQVWTGTGMCIAGIVTGGVGVLLFIATFFTELDDGLRQRIFGGYY